MKPNLLNSVQLTKPNRNAFDLTHDLKLSMRMGELVPTLCMECVPGDTHILGTESLFRLAPLVAPMMHRVDVTHHYFFVPYRLLWKQWEDFVNSFNTQINRPLMPYSIINNDTEPQNYTRLMNYLGIPIPNAAETWQELVSALPMLAYNLIWQEYYRDQNLQTDGLLEFPIDNANYSGDPFFPNDEEYWQMKRRCWEHDYLTSALPFAQKGQSVNIPIADFNDVPVNYRDPGGVTGITVDAESLPGSVPFTLGVEAGTPENLPASDSELYAETSELIAGAASINDLRLAFKLQEFLERDARGGTRYTEKILAHFGVKSSDARLQRPEYITGSKSPITISEVLNTTGTEALPQGNMAGHGAGLNVGKFGTYRCEEYGFIMCMTSVMPKPAYFQGMPKIFTKRLDPLEYFWPSFAHLGEQEIKTKEVYAFSSDSEETFGYTPRYAEYKFMNNRVAGDFQTTLDFWTMARKFAAAPSLNADFVKCVPTNDVFAVTDDIDNVYAQIIHRITSIRPMPKFGTPSF